MRKYPLLLLLFLATPVQAEVYKWTDDSGSVHYTDQPPPKAKSKTEPHKLNIKSQPAPPASTSKTASPKSANELDLEFRKRRTANEEAKSKEQKAEAEAKTNKQNCIQAQGNLRNLQEGGRVAEFTASGEKVPLDDAARQRAIEGAKKAVAGWCK